MEIFMLLINDSPFLTLDEYVDIDNFLNLQHEWEFLFSSNLKNVKEAVWSGAGFDPYEIDNYKDIFRESDWIYFSYKKANDDRKADLYLDQHLSYFENQNDKRGLARYLKLRYKSFDPYFALNIRKNIGPHESADSKKLTDIEWEKYFQWQPYVENFPNIKKFIHSLPLEKIGNIVIHYSEHYVPAGYHRDYNYFPFEKGNFPKSYPHREEFIWLRFDLNRPFYIFDLDKKTGTVNKQIPVQGYSAFFNDHNWHGSFDHHPNASLTVKVEGKFTEELRRSLGISHIEWYD